MTNIFHLLLGCTTNSCVQPYSKYNIHNGTMSISNIIHTAVFKCYFFLVETQKRDAFISITLQSHKQILKSETKPQFKSLSNKQINPRKVGCNTKYSHLLVGSTVLDYFANIFPAK